MTIIEKIKVEIERLKTVQLKRIQEGDLVDAEPYDKNEAYNELLSFLDTLESEKPVPADLEEAADKYEQEYSDDETLGMAFIAGAKWQKERDQETIKLSEINPFLAGVNYQKEQMMKEAVECELVCIKDRLAAILPMKEFQWTVGDKVRIIIVKED